MSALLEGSESMKASVWKIVCVDRGRGGLRLGPDRPTQLLGRCRRQRRAEHHRRSGDHHPRCPGHLVHRGRRLCTTSRGHGLRRRRGPAVADGSLPPPGARHPPGPPRAQPGVHRCLSPHHLYSEDEFDRAFDALSADAQTAAQAYTDGVNRRIGEFYAGYDWLSMPYEYWLLGLQSVLQGPGLPVLPATVHRQRHSRLDCHVLQRNSIPRRLEHGTARQRHPGPDAARRSTAIRTRTWRWPCSPICGGSTTRRRRR